MTAIEEKRKYRSATDSLAPKGWTQTALDCYKRGCICTGCIFENAFESSKCKMKASVMELVRIYGKPYCVEHFNSDGSTEYVLLSKKTTITKHCTQEDFSNIASLVSSETLSFIQQISPTTTIDIQILAGLLLDGYSKDFLSKLFKVHRGTINYKLAFFYKSSNISFKTKYSRDKELISFYKKMRSGNMLNERLAETS